MASRCFAFEPLENQADDAKGVIMIPNIGEMGFYLGTMISDLTSDVLLGLSQMVRVFSRTSINSTTGKRS